MAVDVSQLASKWEATGSFTLLPDPEPRERRYTIISVDDHLVEPPDLFTGRLPGAYAERAPKVIEEDGTELWVFDGERFPNVGFNAVAGRPIEEHSAEPTRFDQMRRGAWDIHERIRDMDINGVYASLNFPSFVSGFAGTKFATRNDPDLGLAVMRAWNDWHIEAWTAPYPDRIIPCQLPWLLDPEIAAEEVRRNAERGFKAITFPELPENVGLPSLHSGYWTPFLRACEETQTPICLHIGSGGMGMTVSSDSPTEVFSALFPINSMLAAVEWLFAKIPIDFPDIKIVLAEGGIGWVPALMDRLEHNVKHHRAGAWRGVDISPTEALLRNFWFCALDDTRGFEQRHHIGVENILFEVDYPHADSTWPDSQEKVTMQLGSATPEEIRLITHENASRLFRHPIDPAWLVE